MDSLSLCSQILVISHAFCVWGGVCLYMCEYVCAPACVCMCAIVCFVVVLERWGVERSGCVVPVGADSWILSVREHLIFGLGGSKTNSWHCFGLN